ncbi:coiled-coil domain-containing protein AGAP005037 [Anopheles bellator]|uniref:coiled-coil domain-containing protein AGAP005037 n=1 Tax=Anopheles bellator TaxID=139047 RepID=UPI002648A939|nr:coiled-coil domain-containing protein AGAP005037 [Anopheles bellator]
MSQDDASPAGNSHPSIGPERIIASSDAARSTETFTQSTFEANNDINEAERKGEQCLSSEGPAAATRRKCVRFTTSSIADDAALRKFIEGDEILDQRNPFKNAEHTFGELDDGQCISIVHDRTSIDKPDAMDNDFITKDEILRQSKYVKTYIKNPDKQLNYDESVIHKLNAIRATGRDVRDVVVVAQMRPPIPAPRTIRHETSDRNNNNEGAIRWKGHNDRLKMQRNVGKPVPRLRRVYSDLKVRTGLAEAEKSLYDSNEVVLNALKFDSRFRTVEFGSQDDIDTIAEKTDDGDPESALVGESEDVVGDCVPPTIRLPDRKCNGSEKEPIKHVATDDGKKSFSNTVKSADFRKYLHSKGLSLVPAKQKSTLVNVADEAGAIRTGASTTPRASTKLSVLTKFLQNSLFATKSASDSTYQPMLQRSSTPVQHSGIPLPAPRSSTGRLIKRSASVDAKPKLNFRQIKYLDDGNVGNQAGSRPASAVDFNRSKLRSSTTDRQSVNRRPMRHAGVQVNLEGDTTDSATVTQSEAFQRRQLANDLKVPPTYVIAGQHAKLRRENSSRMNGGTSTHTVVPVYSEPLRDASMITNVEGRRGDPISYHIYEQTPDNLRREMLYGRIGYLNNSQLSAWHPQDRRSFSSMQEGPTYGRIRPPYVSSPLSTQSTPVRRTSDTLNRQQILQKVYDFYRRSVRASTTSVANAGMVAVDRAQPKNGAPLFLFERQHRVQRAQSLNDARVTPAHHGPLLAPAAHPRPNASKDRQPNQHDRNIENIYAFVHKKMHQLNVHGEPRSIASRPVAGSRPSTATFPRRVTFFNSQQALPPLPSSHAIEEADYVNIRGAPDEDDWQNDKSNRNQPNDQGVDDRRRSARSREDPRRHTLGGDMLQYQAQTQPPNIQRSLEFENAQMRVYTPTNQGPLFDDDPGIMSEAETASTGFRRGGKQRSSLPVVRTPSKTLERPLGLVFLQYRSETKRALLPNEITSIDTVRALFVRSFPRQLTMQYLEGPNVKIYIHDSSKDMFYELEDVRSHLREIRDRSVLRLFESNEVSAPQMLPGGQNIPQPLQPAAIPNQWDQEQSYFSEPEFDSEYQHQHIHKSKQPTKTPYYVGTTQTLPRGMYSDRNKGAIGVVSKPIRSYGSRSNMAAPMPYTTEQLYNIPDGYMSSPERSGASRGAYEEPYYSQYGTRSAAVAPIIDEEQGDISIADDQYAMYGVKNVGRIPRVPPNQMYDHTRSEDLHRIRVEHMERQLANLTGLVQKALTQNPSIPLVNNTPNILNIPGQYRNAEATGDGTVCTREKPPKLGKSTCHKSVSFEKSVSFSDDIQGVQKSHSPQHSADSKPPKPAIKSSTLPRTSSQERDRLKPPPPPKPLVMAPGNQYRTDLTLAPEVYNQLRGLQKKAMDLRTEARTLRRLTQTQAVAVREDIKDTFMRIRATLLSNTGFAWGQDDKERTNLTREEEIYKQEVIRLEKDLADLESSVEGLRGEVINRRTRVNMVAVEDMALVLSRASKTVAELKMRFPVLQQGLRNLISSEMERVCREEAFLKDEPDRLENALRRCKKLTGTLVTLKRLASVQEQRLPIPDTTIVDETVKPPETHHTVNKPIPSPRLGTTITSGGIAPENALDALLDELQTFAKPPNGVSEHRPDDSTSDDSSQTLQNSITTKISQSQLYPSEPHSSNVGLRRLHSYPSGSDTDTSPPQPNRPNSCKPPVPERNADLLSKVNNKRVPPPPPPRTSSRSPLASPTTPHVPHHRGGHQSSVTLSDCDQQQRTSEGTDSGSESVCSDNSQRQLALELRHQELLKKQRQLQEQYQRLQQMSKNAVPLAPGTISHDIKKTGSESNLPMKMGYSMTVSGSMKNLCVGDGANTFDPAATILGHTNNSSNIEMQYQDDNDQSLSSNASDGPVNGKLGTLPPHLTKTTNKVYETDIL